MSKWSRWTAEEWRQWNSRHNRVSEKRTARKEVIDQQVTALRAQLAAASQSRAEPAAEPAAANPTYAQVLSQSYDGSQTAIEQRRTQAARLKKLIEARDALDPSDPMRAVLTEQVDQRRRGAMGTGLPGSRLDAAMHRVAAFQVKHATAKSQLEKQQHHLAQVEGDLEQAQAELAEAKAAVGATGASLYASCSPMQAEVAADPVAYLRASMQSLAAVGFRAPPSRPELSQAMDIMWAALNAEAPVLEPQAGHVDTTMEAPTFLAEDVEDDEPTDEQVMQALAGLAEPVRRRLMRKTQAEPYARRSQSSTSAAAAQSEIEQG